MSSWTLCLSWLVACSVCFFFDSWDIIEILVLWAWSALCSRCWVSGWFYIAWYWLLRKNKIILAAVMFLLAAEAKGSEGVVTNGRLVVLSRREWDFISTISVLIRVHFTLSQYATSSEGKEGSEENDLLLTSSPFLKYSIFIPKVKAFLEMSLISFFFENLNCLLNDSRQNY